jgi:hypothetical protein
MYDHIGLHVKNLAAAIKFYEAALAPFGYEVCSRDSTSAASPPAGATTARPACAPTTRRPTTPPS